MKETTNMGENRQLDDTKTPVPNVSVETSNAESLASAIDMKDWFSELSIEERVAALGFADGPVLSTFLQLASLSGASTSTHGTHPSHQQQHSAQERTTDKPMKGQYMHRSRNSTCAHQKKKRHSHSKVGLIGQTKTQP